MDWAAFGVFFTASFVLAIIPGPGMLYVLARTIKGGRREGMLSTLGTGVGGLLHTLAAALGVSAILVTSAAAFFVIKWLGVAYLIYLGVRALLERDTFDVATETIQSSSRGAFIQGILTEALNPKTALFFLAFIPQFVNPNAPVFAQFPLLGFATTLITSSVALSVAFVAGPLNGLLARRRRLRRAQNVASGATLIGLGVYVAVER